LSAKGVTFYITILESTMQNSEELSYQETGFID
jgi:hypothetical protein